MAGLAFEDLGSDIVRCTANRTLLLAVKVELSGQTEVTKFNLHLFIQKEVSQFEITMDDSVRV